MTRLPQHIKLSECKLDQILGTKQYFRSYGFLVVRSYGYFYLVFQSSGFLFIWSSGFGLMDQLLPFSPNKIVKKKKTNMLIYVTTLLPS